MKINKGINRSSTRANRVSGDWERAKNVVLNDGGQDAINELGFSSEFTVTKEVTIDGTPTVKSLYITGICKTPNEIVIFSCGYGYSQIDVYRDDTRITILSTQHLSFREALEINAVYKYNYLGELIVAWCDGTDATSNPPRILNLDNLPFEVDVNKELVNSNQIKFSLLSPNISNPNISTVDVLDYGGYIKLGVYYFSICYVLENGDTTNYLLPSKPIKIAKIVGTKSVSTPVLADQKIIPHQPVDPISDEDDDYSTQTIKLFLDNIDTDYSKFRLAVIAKTGSTVEANIVGEYEIDGSTKNVTFTGNTTDSLNLEEVTIPNISFDKVQSLTKLDNKLITAGVITKSDLDYQKYANAIQVSWGATNVPYDDKKGYYGNARNSTIFVGAMPGEVYALFIHLILKDGSITPGYHIPGREAETISGATVLENALLSDFDGSPTPDVNELDIHEDVKYFHVRETASVGKLGYWENQNEVYPNTDDFKVWSVGGDGKGYETTTDLRGEKVRHHKMPEVALVHDNTPTTYINKYIYLTFSNIKIPDSILEDVVGYTFSFASRADTANRTIVTHSIYLHDDLPTAPSTDDVVRIYDQGLTAVKLPINARYVKSLYKIYSPSGTPRIRATKFETFDSNIRCIDKIEYTPENNSAIDPVNTYREECIRLFGSGESGKSLKDFGAAPYYRFVEVRNYVEDVFYPFYNQSLALFGNVHNTSTANTYTSIGPQAGLDSTFERLYLAIFNDNMGPKNPYYGFEFIQYNTVNTAYVEWVKVADHAKIGEDHFPCYGYYKSGVVNLYNIEYNTIFNSVNNIKTFYPYNPYSNFTDNLLKTLYRSDTFQTETLEMNWRYFRTDAYSNEVQDRGNIVKVITDDVNLFIQYRNGLYVVRLNDQLQISADVVAALGEADIFSGKPKPLLSKDGKIIHCTGKSFIQDVGIGFIIIDRDAGRIFAKIGNEITTISDIGLRDYFRGKLKGSKIYSSPLFLNGGSAEFDSYNDRLLVANLHENFSREYNFSVPIEYNTISIPIVAGETYSVTADLHGSGGVILAYDVDNTEQAVGFKLDGTKTFVADRNTLKLYLFNYCEVSLTISSTTITDKSFTYSFDIGSGKWIAQHEYKPEYLLATASDLFGVKNDQGSIDTSVFKHNVDGTYGVYYDGTTKACYIDILANDSAEVTKLLKSIFWITSVRDGDVYKWDNTITHILIYNDTQCSGLISLTSMTSDDGNVKYMDGSWQFDDFEDVVIDPTQEFIDIDGNLIDTNLAGTDLTAGVSTLVAGNEYEVYNGTSSSDYIEYNSDRYYNGDIFTAVSGVTSFADAGTAILRTAKNWYNKGNIRGKYAVIRLYFDNISQYYLEFSQLITNFKQQF